MSNRRYGVMPVAARIGDTLLIDAHVHCHRCFDPAAFLAAAACNLAAAARPEHRPATGCLLFTEMAADHVFRDLRDGRMAVPGWRLAPTAEDNSLLAIGPKGDFMVLVAGRQIVTGEGLEVLALGHDGPFADGAGLEATVAAVRAAGALPVLPWAFGKWWGRRGRALARFVEQAEPRTVFLGDNGSRLAVAPPPRPFARAAARGIWTLAGSDPLPFAAESTAVGRYAFVLGGPIDPARPAAGLLRQLRDLERQPEVVGRRQRLAPFLSRQIAMQLRRRTAA